MIVLTPKIKQDLSSSVNNFDLLVNITASGKNYYLGTQSATIDGQYYDDVIIKIGGAKESIDLRNKKVKLGGSSITINNAEINGKRFSDTISGEMFGGVVDIYIKTQSCRTLDDCKKISSLQIQGVIHDSNTITLQCEDKYIDEFHKELPLAENTLYDGVNTFVGDNEKRVPILYGHLKEAPAVLYVKGMDIESPFIDNNVLIFPDRAYLTKDTQDEYDIIGITNISPYAEQKSRENQLINEKILSIKLGDAAATVYSSPPDRLHRELAKGNSLADFEYKTDFLTQFRVSDDKSHINLFTISDSDAPDHISGGNLFCGEVSKLIGVKTYKAKIYRADDTAIDGMNVGAAIEDEVFTEELTNPHFANLSTQLLSTTPNKENFDMLSLPAFYINDIDSNTNYTTGIDNGLRIGINKENYAFEFFLDFIDFSPVWSAHLLFDIPIFELEFEPLKASADQATGKEDTYADASLVGAFYHRLKTINEQNVSSGMLPNMEYIVYPAQGKQKSENQVRLPYVDADEEIAGEILMSEDILGIPSFAWGALNTEAYEYSDWFNEYNTGENKLNLYTFTNHLRRAGQLRVQSHIDVNAGANVEDYRHTFHTTRQLDAGGDDINNWLNTWRNWYKTVERTNWLSQNVYTGIALPAFQHSSDYYNNEQQIEFALNTQWNGMALKRSWYQKECFKENFFVDAKGKYIQMPNTYLSDNNPQIMYGENLSLQVVSDQDDTGNDDVARTQNDNVLLQLFDYLTKDRFKKHVENGKEYELVITGTTLIDQNAPRNELVFFDFDTTDFRADHSLFSGKMWYQFVLNSKIFRQTLDEGIYEPFWECEQAFVQTIKLQYASRNLDGNGRIINWTFLDDFEATAQPFTILDDNNNLVTRSFLEFNDDILGNPNPQYDNQNCGVYMYFDDTNIVDGLSGEWVEPTIYTDMSMVKQLITKPSDVVQDIVTRELGLSNNIIKKNIIDDKYKLDFSIDKTEEGIDVMQKIAQSSPFFYKNELTTGKPSIVGIKYFYDNSDVDKKININQILKHRFKKTKKQDVALKCRVKYGYDYVAEEYKKVTDDVEHSTDELYNTYVNNYNIKDEDSYVLEHEAPYIQDKISAEMLAKHLFEIHKNQHLNINFQLPLGDALELEVGDVISFVDNNGIRSDIDNTKPFGKSIKSVSFLNEQAVFPYFIITSIKKDLNKADLEVTQLHELAPSQYDDWTQTNWSDTIIDPITGDVIIPPEPNNPPIVDIISVSGAGQFPEQNLSNAIIVCSMQDADGQIVGYQSQVENFNTGEIIHSYEDNTIVLDNPTFSLQPTIFLPPLPEYETYRFRVKAFDDNGAFTEDAMLGVYQMYPPSDPIAVISYIDGLQGVSVEIDDNDFQFNPNTILYSSGGFVEYDEINLPYNEEGYELTLSAALSQATIPPQGLSYRWEIQVGDDQFEYFTEQVTIDIESGVGEVEIFLEITDQDEYTGGNTENISMNFIIATDLPPALNPRDVFLIDFPSAYNYVQNWEELENGDIVIYSDYVSLTSTAPRFEVESLVGGTGFYRSSWFIEQSNHNGHSEVDQLAYAGSFTDGSSAVLTFVNNMFSENVQWSGFSWYTHGHEVRIEVSHTNPNDGRVYYRQVFFRINTHSSTGTGGGGGN